VKGEKLKKHKGKQLFTFHFYLFTSFYYL